VVVQVVEPAALVVAEIDILTGAVLTALLTDGKKDWVVGQLPAKWPRLGVIVPFL
jgi:hypothetical protein